MRMRKLRAGFSWAAISLLVITSLASAEPYFGLYGGVAFPRVNNIKYGDFDLTVGQTSTTVQGDVTRGNQSFDTSGVLGGKFGYFLEPLPFLGFELDVFNVFGPDFAGDNGVNEGPIGSRLRLNTGNQISLNTTAVMLDVVGRLPLLRSQEFPQGRLQPYIGGGGGWVNAQMSMDNRPVGGEVDDSANAWGAQGIAGLKYFFSPNVALYTEYKYVHVFPVTWNMGSGQRVMAPGDTGYDFNMATAGIAFHFPHRPPPPPPPPPPLPPPPPPPPPVAPPQAVIETIVLQSVHFEFDKSRLTPLGRRVLDEAAQKIKDNPRLSVVIEGNTDSIGTELYNLGLGQRRAEVVMGYLVLRHQVDPKRMTPLSYGESRPIADNRTAEGRALNRRVEFKVLVR
jgi:outer membrane protein OmpA-like peptidoglycan-associated protein/opacity protein-like surface antigen